MNIVLQKVCGFMMGQISKALKCDHGQGFESCWQDMLEYVVTIESYFAFKFAILKWCTEQTAIKESYLYLKYIKRQSRKGTCIFI